MLKDMNRHGFTIVELMITITVMVVLLTLGVVNYRGTQVSARDSERKSDVETIAANLETYYQSGSDSDSNTGFYPSTVLTASVSNMQQILRDIDTPSITAPDVTDPLSTFISATNNIQTTAGVTPQPTINQYVYQPIKDDGTLCTASNVSQKITADILVVGGGGAGGNGGGGGGGVVVGTATLSGTTNVTVGAGGIQTSKHGGNSSFGSIIAYGGGFGGRGWASIGSAGGSGGGGGHGGGATYGGASTKGVGGTTMYGNAGGGNGGYEGGYFPGGGGGGAGGAGSNAPSTAIGGAGGIGIASAISGVSTYYGGGGGGGLVLNGTSGGAGGAGGGGRGAYGSITVGTNGTNGLGGGGGGGSDIYYNYTGGSGVVIIKYPTGSISATGGTITYTDSNNLNPSTTPYTNGYTIHKFTSSGTLIVQECRKFNLYYRLEADNSVQMVTSKNQ